MKKIYLTLLALIAFIGVQSASATAYTVFHAKDSKDRYIMKTWDGGDSWFTSPVNISNDIYGWYDSGGFGGCNFYSSGNNNEIYIASAGDLHIYYGDNGTDGGALKVKVGNNVIEFNSRNGQVYSTPKQTMSESSATFQLGFNDGTGWRMIPENQTLAVGTYQAIKRYDDAGQVGSFSMAAGSEYHFELNTANMQIKVVQDSAPEDNNWYYTVNNGTKVKLGDSSESYTFAKTDWAVNDVIRFYKGTTQWGPASDVTLNAANSSNNAISQYKTSVFKIATAGNYSFTLSAANGGSPVVNVQYTAPAADKWYYQIGDGSKELMTESGSSWVLPQADYTAGQNIRFYKNSEAKTYCYTTNNTWYNLKGNNLDQSLTQNDQRFYIETAGKYTFTITGGNMKIDYTAPAVTKKGYINYEPTPSKPGNSTWVYGTSMTYNPDLDVFTIKVSMEADCCFMFNTEQDSGWPSSAYGTNSGNKEFTEQTGEGFPVLCNPNNNVFKMKTGGNYTFTVKGDLSYFSYKRTGGSGGGNWEGADDLNDYAENGNNTDIINYITPSEGSAGDEYSIIFAQTATDNTGSLKQKLTATHSVAAEANYVWMKYETLSWMGENTAKDSEGNPLAPADAIYLSDTHLYENGGRGSLVVTSKFMEELECNSLAELVATRTHCVHHNESNVHTPRNFVAAYYRVYGMHEVSPVVAKNSAKTLSASDRKIKAVVTPSHPSRYEARVAYTREIADNTSGITGVEMDKDVIGSEDVAPVYYNLQGVKVSRPSAGQVYIVKRGDKVTKEIIK